MPAKRADRYCVVFDCESDGGVPNVAPQDRELHIQRFMQFTVTCALKIPSDAILEQRPQDDIIAASTAMHWWRDVAPESAKGNPIEDLLTLFDDADVIVGFNCLQFDFPLLYRFYKMSQRSSETPSQRYMNHRSKCLDIMLRLRDATGSFVKLDTVLKANGLPTKSGSGKEAVRLWADGERDKLMDYCKTDVEVTARLALTETLRLQDVTVPHQVHGLRCAMASRYAVRMKRKCEEEEFVIV